MCGIIGYVGAKCAVPILLEGLSALEYRGYDSAGVALQGKGLEVVRSKGRLSLLFDRLQVREDLLDVSCGIGHTRWATHGEPSDRNAHPHVTDHLALVHNGIIENYAELGALLAEKGYTFRSDTDSEVAACLIDACYRQHGEPIKAIFEACGMMRGSYAFGILFADQPGKIFAIRRDSPLIAAVTGDGALIASDVTAILSHSREYYRLEEGVVAVCERGEISFYGQDGARKSQKTERVDWDVTAAQKGGWPHFMMKEIMEEPEVIARTVSHYLKDGMPHFGISMLDAGALSGVGRLHIVACGTAMHAGLLGRAIIEKMARVSVNVEIASEFRYRDPILDRKDLVILLSQSGETADTLASLRYAKSRGVRTLAIVNVVGSSVAREADEVIYTPAGPEIAVASTKAYSVQCAVLYLLALRLSLLRGESTVEEVRRLSAALSADLPMTVAEVLRQSDAIRAHAHALTQAQHLFYIGRDVDHALCIEGSLKLKEISYIHSEAYAAGELKHGTISLIEEGTPVIALMTASHVAEKTVSGIREVRARGARVLLVITPALASKYDVPCDARIILPEVEEYLAPFVGVTALQLLAYHTAALKGLDVDKPRNLAKSVTVE